MLCTPHIIAGRLAFRGQNGRMWNPSPGSSPDAPGSSPDAPGASAGGIASTWDPAAPGILTLPSGRLVRGRGLRRPLPAGATPEFGVYLLGSAPPPVAWENRWLRWPDFRLPANRTEAAEVLHEAWRRAATERVEIACGGGLGRTGTALACLAVLDGVPPDAAVAYVRERYHRRAVETPWQRRYVRRYR